MLSATRMLDRQVVEGDLGCHLCRAHYPIRGGVARFDEAPSGSEAAAASAPRDDAVLRLAALLGLAEPGGIVLLLGQHAELTPDLALMVGETQIVVINAPVIPLAAGSVSSLISGLRLPLATASCRAAAVDSERAGEGMLAEIARVLRPGGRLLAPVGIALPEGVVELARDDSGVVAERRAGPGPLVSLGSARRK